MKVIRVSKEEYEKTVPNREVFFNEPAFCELNSNKVDEVHYLLIAKDTSYRFGLIAGVLNGVMKCPFSAPYSYPVEIRSGAKVEAVDEALEALESYCNEIGVKEIRFIFPPLFYNEHLLSAWVSAFYRRSYKVTNLDISYALDLEELTCGDYTVRLPEKGRKGLRKSKKMGLTVQHCKTDEEIEEAYNIIKYNHDSKGRPTRLTLEQLMDTMKLVEHDVFIVRHEGKGIVAEVLYRINDRIVQGIYCGYIPECWQYNGMNFLTDYTIHYYAEQNYKILDKATATEESIPNYGLCDFKESVGCKRSLKYSFTKQL